MAPRISVELVARGLAVSVALAACGAPVPINSMQSFKHPESGGIKRAAFELSCPEEQLQVVDLGGSTVGVSGCGQKAIYKLVPAGGWVNNTGADQAKKDAPR